MLSEISQYSKISTTWSVLHMESNVKFKELENKKVINKGSYWADVKGYKISLGISSRVPLYNMVITVNILLEITKYSHYKKYAR